PHPTCEIGLLVCSVDKLSRFDIDLQCVDDNDDHNHRSSLCVCVMVEEEDEQQVDVQ
ncbi:unnamed protein product, partial [Rotaria socialis]